MKKVKKIDGIIGDIKEAERVLAEIQALSNLFSRAGSARRVARRRQEQLVDGVAARAEWSDNRHSAKEIERCIPIRSPTC